MAPKRLEEDLCGSGNAKDSKSPSKTALFGDQACNTCSPTVADQRHLAA